MRTNIFYGFRQIYPDVSDKVLDYPEDEVEQVELNDFWNPSYNVEITPRMHRILNEIHETEQGISEEV